MSDDEKERWRPVDGFPGYEVSDLGRVRKVVSVAAADDSCGHLTVGLMTPKDDHGRSNKRTVRIRDLVAKTFLDEPEPGQVLVHLDEQLDNCGVDNLRWMNEAPDKRTRRRCITCRRPFMSEHVGHRMCDRCRTADDHWAEYLPSGDCGDRPLAENDG